MSKQQYQRPQTTALTPDVRTSKAREELKSVSRRIVAALPDMLRKMDPDGHRFASIVLSLVNQKGMQNIQPEEFARGAVRAAMIGLEPDPIYGNLYLVPYGKALQPVIGYKGCIELARRSGRVGPVYAHAVYPHDTFEIEYGSEEKLRHVPNLRVDQSGHQPIAAYAVAKFVDGSTQWRAMPLWEILRRRDRSSAVRNAAQRNANLSENESPVLTPWDSDFGAMCAKTAIRGLASTLPQCPQLVKGLALEDQFERQAESGAIDVSYEEIMDGPQTSSAPPKVKWEDFSEQELRSIAAEIWPTLGLNEARFRVSVDQFEGSKKDFLLALLREKAEREKAARDTERGVQDDDGAAH